MKNGIAMLIALSMSVALMGCATNPQEETIDELQDDRALMDDVRGQIDRTVFALDTMLRAPAAEIPNAHEEYAAAVEALRESSDTLVERASDLRVRRVDYLTEWERAQLNLNNAELKRAAEQRQQQVVDSLTNLETALRSANAGIAPLLTDLEDIEQVANNDPTPAGIAGVKKSGIVQEAHKRASAANYRLDLAASRFDRALASLAPQSGTRPVATASTPAAPATAATAGAIGTASTPLPSFAQADRDSSNAIEPNEASGFAGLDFQNVDRDSDGKLSESEYEAAAKPASSNAEKR